MGYGFGNDGDALKKREAKLRERYGAKLDPAAVRDGPAKRKGGRPKGSKNKRAS